MCEQLQWTYRATPLQCCCHHLIGYHLKISHFYQYLVILVSEIWLATSLCWVVKAVSFTCLRLQNSPIFSSVLFSLFLCNPNKWHCIAMRNMEIYIVSWYVFRTAYHARKGMCCYGRGELHGLGSACRLVLNLLVVGWCLYCIVFGL